MTSTVRTLLALEIVEITGNELGEYFSNPLKRKLPKYCFTKENKISQTEYYLQFVFEGEDKYYLFNYSTSDSILEEEISMCGLEDLYKFNFQNYLEEFKKIGNIIKYKDYLQNLGTANYIVTDLVFSNSYCEGEWDSDMDVKLIGILDKNLNLLELK